MGVTRKPIQKLSARLEAAYGSYLAPNVQLPFKAKEHKQAFDMIDDESIVGVAQKDLPVQGVRKMSGNLDCQLDVLTCEVILEAAFGANAAGVFTLPTDKNEKSLSLVALDEVKTNKYAGVVINNFIITSEAEQGLSFTGDLIANVAEVRDDTAFPAPATEPGTRITHSHAGGTNGYVRLAVHGAALDSGDNVAIIKSISYGLNWNFTEDFVNAVGSLQPRSAWCETTLDIVLAEHATDDWKTWRDAVTKLQLEAYYYASATATLKMQVPNLIIEEIDEGDEDKPQITLKCRVGRNGTGVAYVNTDMAFVSPLRATVVNS